jgi:hypothetical protein
MSSWLITRCCPTRRRDWSTPEPFGRVRRNRMSAAPASKVIHIVLRHCRNAIGLAGSSPASRAQARRLASKGGFSSSDLATAPRKPSTTRTIRGCEAPTSIEAAAREAELGFGRDLCPESLRVAGRVIRLGRQAVPAGCSLLRFVTAPPTGCARTSSLSDPTRRTRHHRTQQLPHAHRSRRCTDLRGDNHLHPRQQRAFDLLQKVRVSTETATRISG